MKKIALAVAVLISSTGAFAGCTKTDLVGTWAGYSLGGLGGDGAKYCNFTVLKDGSLKIGSSCDPAMTMSLVSFEPITGKLTIDTECHVKGPISQTTDSYKEGFFIQEIDAYLSKGKDSMTGTKSSIPAMMGKNLFVATKTK